MLKPSILTIVAGTAIIGLNGCYDTRDDDSYTRSDNDIPSAQQSPVVDRDINSDPGTSATPERSNAKMMSRSDQLSSGTYIGEQPDLPTSTPATSTPRNQPTPRQTEPRERPYAQSGDHGYLGIPPSDTQSAPSGGGGSINGGVIIDRPLIITEPQRPGTNGTDTTTPGPGLEPNTGTPSEPLSGTPAPTTGGNTTTGTTSGSGGPTSTSGGTSGSGTTGGAGAGGASR
jgi:hypothetical protein